MKKIILFFALSLIVWNCSEQTPTQLLDDTNTSEEQFEVEVIPREQNTFDYTSNYDSTGIIEPMQSDFSIITANGIKNTFGGYTIRQAYFESVFIDKKMPIMNHRGRVIGFESQASGNVKFNNEAAVVVPRIIRIIKNGLPTDTSAGSKYELRKRYLLNNPLKFPYGSKVQFEYEKSEMGHQRTTFDIPTPAEIIGEINLSGSKNKQNLTVALNWNSASEDKIEIIIGGSRRDKIAVKPIFKLRTKDDGELKIPWKFLRTIPFNEFDHLVISFERIKINKITNQMIGENLVVSKSIHNIRFEIP